MEDVKTPRCANSRGMTEQRPRKFDMTNDSKTTDECYELAATLNDAVEVFYEPFDGHESTRIAAKVLAAGYRKPRTVTTAEELDALPVGSVVIDAFGAACVLINKSMYLGWRRCTPAVAGGEHRRSPYLPATVLHEPEAEATR